jgi:hypothetical protein
MIAYFISYVFAGPHGIAAGNCELTVPSPITSMDDVNTITRFLASQGLNNPIVMSFTRLGTAAADGGTTR